MGVGKLWVSVLVAAIYLPTGGCVHAVQSPPVSSPLAEVSGSSLAPEPLPGARRLAVPPAPTGFASEDRGEVLPALAFEEAGSPSPILQTAGIFDKPVEAVKQGASKVSDALTPTTPVTPSDDPTLLSTKSKPTPELYLSLAKYQEELGKLDAAEQSYQQALHLSPKHIGVHLAYARFKEQQGQTRAAIECYQKAARIAPNEAAVYNDLGLLYARHGMNNEALACYGRAIEIQPRRPLYRNNMAMLLVEMGRGDQALKHLTDVYPQADACYKLGYLLQRNNQTPQAVSMFSRALALNPGMTEARVWLDHLQANPGRGPEGVPEVARRPVYPARQASPTSLPGAVTRDDEPSASRMPSESPLAPESRGSLRQLPPVSAPPSIRSRDMTPVPEAVPGLRRLPPTYPERPTAHEEAVDAKDSGVRRAAAPAGGFEEAPLPTAVPPGRTR